MATLASLAESGNVFAASELAQRLAEADVRLEIAECERRHARDALESLPQPVIVTDPFDDVVLMSGEARRLFDVPADVRPSGPLSGFVRDEGLLTLIGRTRGLHTRGATRRSRRTVQTAQGLRVFDCHLLCVCDHRDGTPSPWGVVTFLRDVQPLDRERIAEVTATIAHEFRTPLTTLKACLEMFLDGEAADDNVRRQLGQAMYGEVERLCRMVDHVQLLHRIDCGQVEPPGQVVPLGPLLRDVVTLTTPHAAAAGLTLTLSGGEAEATVTAHRDLLQQAVLNLVCNAIKYTPRGGRVSVSLERVDDAAHVEVQDTGVGISPDDLPYVFDRFYRSDRSRRMAPGCGLGLALVRQIVETVHSGTVTLQSAPNAGTTVRIRLPLHATTPNDHRRPRRTPGPTVSTQPGLRTDQGGKGKVRHAR